MEFCTDAYISDLSRVLKSQFRGLKKLIEGYPNMLRLGGDHSFNPHVYLVESPSDTSTDGASISDESGLDTLTTGASCLSGGCAGFSLHTKSQIPAVRANVGQSESDRASTIVPTPKAVQPVSTFPGRSDSMEAYRPRPATTDRLYQQQPPPGGYGPQLVNGTNPPNGSRLHADAEEFEPSLLGSSLASRNAGGHKYPPVYEEYYSRSGERERDRASNAPPAHLMRHHVDPQIDRTSYPSYRQGLVPPSRSSQEYISRPLPQTYQPAYRSAVPPPQASRPQQPVQVIRERFVASDRYPSGYTTSGPSSRERLDYDDRNMQVYYSSRGGERDDPYRGESGARRGVQAYMEYAPRPQGEYGSQSSSRQHTHSAPLPYGGGGRRMSDDDGGFPNLIDRDYHSSVGKGPGENDRHGFFFSQNHSSADSNYEYRLDSSDKGRGVGEYSNKHERPSFGSTDGLVGGLGYRGLDLYTEDQNRMNMGNGNSVQSLSTRDYGDDSDSNVMAYFLGDDTSYSSK